MAKFAQTFILSAIASVTLAACGGAETKPAEPAATSQPAASASGAAAPAADGTPKRVAITAIVEHPALDAVRKGVEEQLAADGYKVGTNLTIDFQSAQGNTATAGQIAKKFAGDKPDVIVAIATPSAQSVVAATREVPVVFAAVTDPVAAKLVTSWEPSGTNVTGVSDELPLEPQIDLMKKLVPNVKAVGYVYSPGEVNSTVILEKLKTQLKTQGIEVIGAPAQRTTDISTAANSLAGKVQMIYTTTDNNVVSGYESLYKVAAANKIPLLASDTDTVKRGASAALGVNYHDMGMQAGKIVTRILKGEKPGAIATQKMEKLDLFVNPKAAQSQGFTIPEELVKSAKEVIQ